MSPQSNADRITRGEDVGVDVSAIEREFATLWRTAGGEVEGGSHAVTRACLANLLVWVEDEALMPALKAAFDAMVVSVPARVLVMHVEAAKEGVPEFETFISANCILAPGGGKLVCSEEVTLISRGAGSAHLGSVVRALLVPDVPVMMLMPRPPRRDTKAFAGMLSLCDRLILDTGALTGLASWRDLDVLLRKAPPTVDLNWLGLSSMRSALASVFDHAQPREALGTLESVSLHAPTDRLAGRLVLLGWLADRLGWKEPEDAGAGGATWRTPDGMVEVHVASDGDAQAPMGLTLATRQGNIHLSRGQEPVATIKSLDMPERHLALDPSSMGERLARSMGPGAKDACWDGALAATLALVRTLHGERVLAPV